MDMKRIPVYGTMLENNPLGGSSIGSVSLPGKFAGRSVSIKVDENILSKHIMLIGGTGCGKSNVFTILLVR